jgi:hypothetical protein
MAPQQNGNGPDHFDMISDTPSGGIGEKLREARQHGGISLKEIADATKISVSMLQALERNDISRLPGGVYGRGYVRSFATAVALDPEAAVAEFVTQFPVGSVTDGYPPTERVEVSAIPRAARPGLSNRTGRSKSATLLGLAAVGALPAALVVYLGAAKALAHWSNMQGSIVSARAVPGRTVIEVDETAGAIPLLAAGVISVEASAPVPTAPAAAPDVHADAHAVPVVDSSRPLTDYAPELLAVVLAARSPSWVIATVDGAKVVNRLFQVGDEQMLEARRDLVLTTGDAGAIVMTLNGRRARSLGQPGETVTARVSRTNFRDYLRR